MRTITQQEIAAIWLYHQEYAASRLSAIEFYKHLGQYEKNAIDRMITAICKSSAQHRNGVQSGSSSGESKS